MRTISLVTMMFFLTIQLMSQDYSLVRVGTKNLYLIDISDSTYSLAIDSSVDVGNVTRFYTSPFVGDYPDKTSLNCGFWGSQDCISFTKYGLLGGIIENHSDSLWLLFTHDGDTAIINSSLTVGQSRKFISFEDYTYYLKCVSIQSEDILGVTDLVKTYEIFVKDQNGVTITTTGWTGVELKVSKSYGLIKGFDISNFPVDHKVFDIAGSVELQKGLFRIRSADVYNYTVGDIFQYRETYYKNEYPNPNIINEVSYVRYKVLERTDNALGFYYKFERVWFSANSIEQGIDTIQQVYSSQDTLAYIPIETSSAKDFDMLTKNTLINKDFAGTRMWSLLRDNDWDLRYCAQDLCFGATDTQGRLITDLKEVVLGLGDFKVEFTTVYPMSNYSTISEKLEMVYFNKQGFEWGTEAFVGIETIGDRLLNISFYPNPVNKLGTVECPVFGFYKIIDINGKTLLSGYKNTKLLQLDVSGLPNGLFMLILQSGSDVMSTRFIKSM